MNVGLSMYFDLTGLLISISTVFRLDSVLFSNDDLVVTKDFNCPSL